MMGLLGGDKEKEITDAIFGDVKSFAASWYEKTKRERDGT
jgi:hypothetical protein